MDRVGEKTVDKEKGGVGKWTRKKDVHKGVFLYTKVSTESEGFAERKTRKAEQGGEGGRGKRVDRGVKN